MLVVNGVGCRGTALVIQFNMAEIARQKFLAMRVTRAITMSTSAIGSSTV